MTDRPRLGAAFRSAPDRTTGLPGLLDTPSESAADPDPAPAPRATREVDDAAERAASPSEDSAPAAPPRRRGRRAGAERTSRSSTPGRSTGPASAEDIPRVVPVVLDAPVLARLREHGRSSGLTHGLIALGAIEKHIDVLASRWSAESTPSPPGALFGRTQPQHRRAEPGVQTQLRLAAGDAEVLDGLVGQWSAPSRSALVNDALALELGAGVA